MKRPLFVFAGQSNMMGAAVYEASEQIVYKDSYEYLHKPKRFGKDMGELKKTGFPTGEFVYNDLKKAYKDNYDCNALSDLDEYHPNTYFASSMSNLKNEQEKQEYDFNKLSEADKKLSTSLAPYMISLLENEGLYSVYTHIAKGSVGIKYFVEGEAANYFDEKATDFFNDCQTYFENDDTSERILVWLQGESDWRFDYNYYMDQLALFWQRCEKLGFTKFFIVRVGYFGSDKITEIMKAQEDFCKANENAYIITRVGSFLKFYGNDEQIFNSEIVEDEFLYCRDSFYGFSNQHINEKGFKTIAKYAVPNVLRILLENKQPILEKERIKFNQEF